MKVTLILWTTIIVTVQYFAKYLCKYLFSVELEYDSEHYTSEPTRCIQKLFLALTLTSIYYCCTVYVPSIAAGDQQSMHTNMVKFYIHTANTAHASSTEHVVQRILHFVEYLSTCYYHGICKLKFAHQPQ